MRSDNGLVSDHELRRFLPAFPNPASIRHELGHVHENHSLGYAKMTRERLSKPKIPFGQFETTPDVDNAAHRTPPYTRTIHGHGYTTSLRGRYNLCDSMDTNTQKYSFACSGGRNARHVNRLPQQMNRRQGCDIRVRCITILDRKTSIRLDPSERLFHSNVPFVDHGKIIMLLIPPPIWPCWRLTADGVASE